MSKLKPSIAIDGPSGSGKSTTAQVLAKRLNLLHLNTGAMYRAMAVAMSKAGVDLSDARAIEENLASFQLEVKLEDGKQINLVNSQDMDPWLYSSEASLAASALSKNSALRAYLVEIQRELAAKEGIILDGRDIGTVVLPDADIKFFLTADPEERARRRFKDLEQAGEDIEFAEVLEDILARDKQDSTRADSPLRKAEDAIEINSTTLSFEQVISLMIEHLQERDLI